MTILIPPTDAERAENEVDPEAWAALTELLRRYFPRWPSLN